VRLTFGLNLADILKTPRYAILVCWGSRMLNFAQFLSDSSANNALLLKTQFSLVLKRDA
jgi:hypothetical protein